MVIKILVAIAASAAAALIAYERAERRSHAGTQTKMKELHRSVSVLETVVTFVLSLLSALETGRSLIRPLLVSGVPRSMGLGLGSLRDEE